LVKKSSHKRETLRRRVCPRARSAKTGARVSIIGVGGSHAGRIPEAEGTRFMHMAVDEGVTFFDNAWDYGGGSAEEIMGKNLAMDGYRKKGLPDDQELRPRLQGFDEVPR
jgi:diketogulonate reductase-like aldo/keto reductase